MYQGENQTALESQKQISEAFLELMSVKKYADITVKEICAGAGVSRQTFYTLFQTKENVIRYQMKKTCCHPNGECCMAEGHFSIEVMCDAFAEFIYLNYDFFGLLIEHDLSSMIYDSVYRAFDQGSCKNESLGELEREAIYSFMTGGLTSFIGCIVPNKDKKDLDYLKGMIRYLFLGSFFEVQR